MDNDALPMRKTQADSNRLTAYVPIHAVEDYKALKAMGVDSAKLIRDAIVRVLTDAKSKMNRAG